MPKPAKYSIGGIQFATKRAILDHAKMIKNRYTPDTPIDNEKDIEFLTDLLNHHYDAQTRLDPNDPIFVVSMNAYRTGLEFRIIRQNCTHANFAPDKCIINIDPINRIFEACRSAIVDQISVFKTTEFGKGAPIACPYYHDILTPDTCHVDHKYPKTFAALVRQWMQVNNFTLDTIEIGGAGPADAAKFLANPIQLASWQDYHTRKAELRIVSPRANLSDCRRA